MCAPGFRRWLREPLVQFALVGGLLFAGYHALNPESGARTTSNRIVITPDDLKQMSAVWLAKGLPPPSSEQWRSLIETKVREEVLYREALALGLDRDDTIVKRRMVQKMDFLAQDIAGIKEPTAGELEAWFNADKSRFAIPGRVSFRHVYFSADRGPQAKDAAARGLAKIAGASKDAPAAAALGDPFMFQDYYPERTLDQMAKQFGPAFARSLFQLKPGSWQGPIESGYGWHLVFVDVSIPERVPGYDEVTREVKTEWIAAQSDEAQRKAYERMRARYEVVLPDATAPGKAKAR